MLGCSSTPGDAIDPADEPATAAVTGDDAPPAAVGTITKVTFQPTCTIANPLGRGMPGFRCALLTVACPGLDSADVDVALAPGTGKGVIVTHAGSDGTAFLTNQLASAMFQRGWSLAQIAWHLPWECPKHTATGCAADATPPAQRATIAEAGCRPATVMKWIHDRATLADGSRFLPPGKPYCGHGSSGGSGAFLYALTRYGLGALLDRVTLQASTPFGRIDLGCDPSSRPTRVPAPCDNTAPPSVFVNFMDNNMMTNRVFDRWLSTSRCDVSPSAAELAMYARSSIVASGASFSFATPITTYDCVDPPTLNVVPGAGHFVHDALHAADPNGTKFRGSCVVNGSNGTCTGEQAFDDPSMLQTAINELDTRCTPLPR